MSDMWSLALRIVIDIAIVVGGSILIGALAPRWPDAWLARDRGPLRLSRFDTPARYRALHVTTLSRRLPELGSAFGGDSGRTCPVLRRQRRFPIGNRACQRQRTVLLLDCGLRDGHCLFRRFTGGVFAVKILSNDKTRRSCIQVLNRALIER